MRFSVATPVIAALLLFLVRAQCASAGPLLSLSALPNPLVLEVGQTADVAINVSGLEAEDRLEFLAATVEFDADLLTAAEVRPGSVIPDVSGFQSGVLSGLVDGNYDASLTADDSAIHENGSLYSFELRAIAAGSGHLQFSFIDSEGFRANVPLDRVIAGQPLVVHVLEATPVLPGDYNRNGLVDASDYVVWRHSLGQTGTGLVADGDGDGMIDNDDYGVWKSNFGATAGSATSSLIAHASPIAVPETATVTGVGTKLPRDVWKR